VLSESLNLDQQAHQSILTNIQNYIGISTLSNTEIGLLTPSEFELLIEYVSSIVEQIEFNHSLESRTTTIQAKCNGHSENVNQLLTESMNPFNEAQEPTLAGKSDIDVSTQANLEGAISEAGYKATSLIESINSPNRAQEPALAAESGINLVTASDINSAISEANDKATIYVETLQATARAYSSTSSEPVQQCLLSIETRLIGVSASSASIDALTEMREFIEELAAYDVLVNNFQPLPIGKIIEEISDAIESGDEITLRGFDREVDRIESLMSSELDTICTDIESFVDTWGTHPSVKPDQWLQEIEHTRNGGSFVETLKIYQTVQTISDNAWTIDGLHSPGWEQFEALIGSLYTKKGYETEVTRGSRDFGVDVWAKNGAERLAIQVKQFGRGNTVGREVVQKLESTLARDKADKAVIVTSSSFASTAIQYAKESENVELIDGEELVRQLIKFEIASPTKH
jgi:hypothetical protein